MALTEEQMELLGERLVPLFQEFERAVIADIARRLKKTERLTETAEIMAVTLRDKGFSPAAIYKRVMEVVNADSRIQAEIAANTLDAKKVLAEEIKALRENVLIVSEELWEEAGNMAFSNDLSVWEGQRKPVMGTAFEQLVKAMAKRATDDLLNLTKTTGFRMTTGELVDARRTYVRQVNLAFTKVASGAYSYGQAVEEAVRELAKSGLRSVDFASGVTRQLDTAVRTAVMTASSQLAGEITMQNVAETGVDYVEVSAHWGAREGEGHADHAGWQGKVYRVQGEDEQYENLEKATGYPSDPAGLCGYNCRHTFYPYWPGISEPNEWPPEPGPFELDGRTYTYYQATQEQRRREREIRALKREKAAYQAMGLKDKAKETARKIKIRTADYKEFSQSIGIRAKTERLRVCEGNAPKKALKTDEMATASPRFLNKADQLFKNAQHITPIPGYEDVVVHADKYGFLFRDSDGNESNVSVAEFADILKKSDTYHGGAIRLIACESAADGAVTAQALSDLLGVEILAPNDIVYVDPQGKMTVGNKLTGGGKWVKIEPKEKVERSER